MARHQFSAVNLISDPIHGYVELTKRLTRIESGAAGLPDEDAAPPADAIHPSSTTRAGIIGGRVLASTRICCEGVPPSSPRRPST